MLHYLGKFICFAHFDSRGNSFDLLKPMVIACIFIIIHSLLALELLAVFRLNVKVRLFL